MKIELVFTFLLLLCLQYTTKPVDAQGAPSCDRDWNLYRPLKKCYKVYTERVSWNAAKTSCAQLGAVLASVHSAFENNFLLQLAHDTNARDPWLGLQNIDGNLSWADGSDVNFQNTWWPDHPLQKGTHCVLLIDDLTDNRLGWWFDEPCDGSGSRDAGYICMKNAGITKKITIDQHGQN